MLAKVLGAEVVPRTAVVSCTSGCHMSEYAALVRIRLRSLTDTTAEVEMTVEWPSHRTRVPISLHQPWVLFEKQDGRWQFVRTLRVRDT